MMGMSYGQMGMISNDIACMARFLPDSFSH